MTQYTQIVADAKEQSIKLSYYYGHARIPKQVCAHEQYYRVFCSQILLSIQTAGDICNLLHTTPEELQHLLTTPQYKEFDIPKKKKGVRHICQPSARLRMIQHRLLNFLQIYYSILKPDCTHGFVRKITKKQAPSSIVENAKPHVNKQFVLQIDIQDFFTLISAQSIAEMFMSEYFRFSPNVSNILTHIVCYKKSLPMGAPTSPTLSNFICLQLDNQLQAFAQQYDMSYTRYADDITFSSNNANIYEALEQITSIVESHGFTINPSKTRIRTSAIRQMVTGIVVNKKLNVPRTFYKQTRAMLHDAYTNGIDEAAKHFLQMPTISDSGILYFLHVLQGNIGYIGFVRGKEDPIYLKMQQTYSEVRKKLGEL